LGAPALKHQLLCAEGCKFPIFVPAGMSRWKVVAFCLPFELIFLLFNFFFFWEGISEKASCLAVVQTRLEVKRAFWVLENSSPIDFLGDKQPNEHNSK
jgi:hypothetical protein